MTVGPLSLTLLVPGLFGPLPGMGLKDFPEPAWPGLKALLGRGRCTAYPGDVERLRYGLLGYPLSDTHDAPAGWLGYQTDTGRVPAGPVMRADPVHLRADQDRLVLFDAEALNIIPEEAQALVAAFDQLYAGDGLQLEAPTPTRWYLHLPAPAALATTPLARARGRHIDPLLPKGQDARLWHSRITEVQMLFHDHSVNRQREAKGRPTINSLWLWGGGNPLEAVPQHWQRIWSQDPIMRSLARLNGVRCSDVPATADEWLNEVVGDAHLVELDGLERAVAYADIEEWGTRVEQLEQRWFTPLLHALRRGRLRELRLYAADGTLRQVARGDLWRFWRRPCPLLGKPHAPG